MLLKQTLDAVCPDKYFNDKTMQEELINAADLAQSLTVSSESSVMHPVLL